MWIAVARYFRGSLKHYDNSDSLYLKGLFTLCILVISFGAINRCLFFFKSLIFYN